MTVQNKRIPNDLGSAVVEEMASQLNRAMCYHGLHETLAVAGNTDDFPVFVAAEDVYIEDVHVSNTGAFNQAGDLIAIVVGANADLTGGTVAASATAFNPTVVDTVTSLIALMAAGTAAGSLPMRIDAGTLVSLRVTTGAGSAAGAAAMVLSLSYRPVKDALTLRPGVPNKLRNWSTTDR